MKYIAYTYKGPMQHLIESAAYDTREDAAKELFAKLPSDHRSVETARAVEQFGKWRQYGQNIQPVRRDQIALAAPDAKTVGYY